MKTVNGSDRIVAVAVLMPQGAAITVLINRMEDRGGRYVTTENIMVNAPDEKIMTLDRNPRAPRAPIVHTFYIFQLPLKVLEAWTGTKYVETQMFNFADFIKGEKFAS